MNSLGYRLSEARKNSGFTQGQVTEKLFITTQSVSSWECGNSTPDIGKIPEIAELYGVTTDWLLCPTGGRCIAFLMCKHMCIHMCNNSAWV